MSGRKLSNNDDVRVVDFFITFDDLNKLIRKSGVVYQEGMKYTPMSVKICNDNTIQIRTARVLESDDLREGLRYGLEIE